MDAFTTRPMKLYAIKELLSCLAFPVKHASPCTKCGSWHNERFSALHDGGTATAPDMISGSVHHGHTFLTFNRPACPVEESILDTTGHTNFPFCKTIFGRLHTDGESPCL